MWSNKLQGCLVVRMKFLVAVPFTVFWLHLLYALSSANFYLYENWGIKVARLESENVSSVNFYDRHVPKFLR
jgi:hypothetical protein